MEQADVQERAPEGIRSEAVTKWLRDRADDVREPLDFELVAGGRSNLTFRVTDADGRAWALRRPPLHSVLESAHDVAREYRIMSALADTAVPVPDVVGLCEDERITGAPFFVMTFVDGQVIRSASDARSVLTREQRWTVSEELVDVLAILHAVDPDEVGLGDLGRREDYIARQLRRWRRQFEQTATRDLPQVIELHDLLATRIPPQGSARLVHGDYRLDNVMVRESEIRAVLDWELCTLGDPLADVGGLMTFWAHPDQDRSPVLAAPTTVDGFPPRDEIAARYAERSGRDLSDLDYYIAFAHWRLAVILEGVYERFSSGAYGDVDDESYRWFADEVPFLIERGLAMMR
jgi:aminoglycoside phosphotransferase (APT) family kinase protein